MRDFLTEYVQMIAESNDSNITRDMLNRIVESLMRDEEIWNLIDDKIREMLRKEVI